MSMSYNEIFTVIKERLSKYPGWFSFGAKHKANVKSILAQHSDNLSEILRNIKALEPQDKEISELIIDIDNMLVEGMVQMLGSDSNEIKPFLGAVSTLDDAKKMSALMQKDANDFTALIIALRSKPEAVEPLLDVIDTLLNPDLKGQVLLQVMEKNWWTPVMFAVQNNSSAIAPLLAAISGYDLVLMSDLPVNGPEEGKIYLEKQYAALMYRVITPQGKKVKDFLDINVNKLTKESLTLYREAILGETSKRGHTPINTLGPEVLEKVLLMVDSEGNNALMIAAKYNPEAIPLLLAPLNPKQRALALTHLNSEGNNALMIAAQHHFKGVELLLTAIELTTMKASCIDTYALLMQINEEHNTAFMIAAKYQPEAIPLLFAAYPRLSTKALISSDYLGLTVLMIALRHNPLSVEPILAVINTLDSQSKFEVLNSVDREGNNALMLAFRYCHQAVKPLLAVFNSLDSSHSGVSQYEKEINAELLRQREIAQIEVTKVNLTMVMIGIHYYISSEPTEKNKGLTQFDLKGRSVLIQALRYCPAAVDPLLSMINTLGPNQKASVLMRVDNSGRSALMYAAEENPAAVESILASINTLETEYIALTLMCSNALEIALEHCPNQVSVFRALLNSLDPNQKAYALTHVDKEGCNALMIALRYNSQAIKSLLAVMENVDSDQKASMLMQSDKEGCNALMLALQYSPTAIIPLLAIVNTLKPKQKALVLMTLDENDDDILSYAKENYPEALEVLQAAVDTLEPEDRVSIKKKCKDEKASIAVTDFFKTPDIKQEMKKSAEDTLNSDEESAGPSSPRVPSPVYPELPIRSLPTESMLRRRHGAKQ